MFFFRINLNNSIKPFTKLVSEIDTEISHMKKLIVSTSILLFSLYSFAQEYTLNGTIKDGNNGEDLIGVNITVKEKPGVGTTTNVYGFYSLSLPKGNYTIEYSFIGMEVISEQIDLTKNIRKNIELSSGSNKIDEVIVSAERENQNVTSNEMSVTRLEMKEVDKIPVLLGEKDIIKTIQLMPGIKSAGEGSSGFFVRGGGADQNLILLDGAPVYNASHLLGFFSVFNSDAIKDVKLYKGAAPAQYGGRLSSVMDVKMKEGNSKKLSVNGGIGLISSRLTIEAPIVKDKGSFLISGRRTYADMFLMFSSNESTKNTSLYFYDLNLKANYKITENDRIFLSGYFGRDKFGFDKKFGFDWGNKTGTLRWNHIFNEKLFSNTTFIYSDYSYKINIQDGLVEINSSIIDLNLQQDFDYYINNNNKIKVGGSAIYHTFKPGDIETTSTSFNSSQIQNRYSLESALYISNEQKLGSKLTLTYGLRYTNFTQYGAGDIYSYNHYGDIIDTTYYKDWETVASYNGLSPRISANFVVNPRSSIKASLSRNYQYLHLLSNSTSGTPMDVWMPSSNNIKPEIADQVALGYFRNLHKNTYEFSAEIYYKKIQNAVDYRDGAEVVLNDAAEGQLVFGDGRAYGLELLFKKRKGNFTGWLSYTIAKSESSFNEINNGSWYPSRQDRTHDISLVLMYQITERLNVSGSWVYYTGSAVSFPSGKYETNGQVYNLYTSRNGYRMPVYHRLDIGLTWDGKKYKLIKNVETGEVKKQRKKFHSSWNVSVYNLYARENAYMISFEESKTDPNKTEAVQLSLFKIIPSITYNFNF